MNFEPSSNAPVLAIDLGKFNSICCFFDPGSQESRFQTVPTNRGYLQSFLFAQTVGLVAFEACGLSGWLYDPCQEVGLDTRIQTRLRAVSSFGSGDCEKVKFWLGGRFG